MWECIDPHAPSPGLPRHRSDEWQSKKPIMSRANWRPRVDNISRGPPSPGRLHQGEAATSSSVIGNAGSGSRKSVGRLDDSSRGGMRMFIAMNRFRVLKASIRDFENVWFSRDSYLHELPGFIAFHLLRGPEREDHVLYCSHTMWRSY